ncbi:hypothetical protein KA093_01405 [Candidatus Saccharibacteria bacterium]|nr:hypothetical protein [Candidatus Saccharibacteria bacterium]
MTSDQIQDLKQFIEATVGQQLALHTEHLATKEDVERVEQRLGERLDEQDEKLDEILTAVGESLHHQDVRLNDHDDRLRKLERTAA